MIGIPVTTLSTYITTGKIPRPRSRTSGEMTIYMWTQDDIERLRQLLPQVKNLRKTRYAKRQPAVSNTQSAKTKAKPEATQN